MKKYHIYSIFDGYTNESRYNVAIESWKLNSINKIPVHQNECSNLFNDEYRLIPHVKDLIDTGINKIEDDDNYIILFTNLDSCLLPSVDDHLNLVNDTDTQVYGRSDIKFDFNHPLSSKDIEKSYIYGGKDGFAFTKNFWIQNRDKFLNLLFAAEFWDYIFYLQLKSFSNLSNVEKILYHRLHYQKWCDPKYRLSLPSQIHNIKLAKQFLYDNKQLIDQMWNFENLWEKELFCKI